MCRLCVQWVFRVTSRNVCLNHKRIAMPVVPVVCAGWATLPLWGAALERSCHGHQARWVGRERSSDLRVPPHWRRSMLLTSLYTHCHCRTVTVWMSTQWHLVVLSKYLLILNREVIKWTEHLHLHRISFFCDRCLVYFHGNEEHYHFCKCHQSLIIQIHLAGKVV